MVSLTTIRTANINFADAHRHETGRVCVFAGATSGIGAGTLESLARMLRAPIFYIIGRSAERFTSQRSELQTLNPDSDIVFLEAQFYLLADVDAACEQIAEEQQAVDYLYMSPGLIPVNGPEYTAEGLETCFAISFYARMRLVHNLLPLLRQSSRPRVLSVLNAGHERALVDNDLGLEQNWSAFAVVDHSTTMTSLAFDHLARYNDRITFLHVSPGWVRTNNFARLEAPVSSGVAWATFLMFLRAVATMLALLFGISSEEAGERQAFHLTSDSYGPGAWRISHTSESATPKHVLEVYRDQDRPAKVWEHVLRVFEKALVEGSS
ncbi:hypothetical protein GGR54DRAFT_71250 [Hypoxylon sp. NC1633]|nr:hypothetical protein GGR54DRAFT_71250 [Hypoxylon sp. NC1633]